MTTLITLTLVSEEKIQYEYSGSFKEFGNELNNMDTKSGHLTIGNRKVYIRDIRFVEEVE